MLIMFVFVWGFFVRLLINWREQPPRVRKLSGSSQLHPLSKLLPLTVTVNSLWLQVPLTDFSKCCLSFLQPLSLTRIFKWVDLTYCLHWHPKIRKLCVISHHYDGDASSDVSHHSDGGLLFRDQHWKWTQTVSPAVIHTGCTKSCVWRVLCKCACITWYLHAGVNGSGGLDGGWGMSAVYLVWFGVLSFSVDHCDTQTQPLGERLSPAHTKSAALHNLLQYKTHRNQPELMSHCDKNKSTTKRKWATSWPHQQW